MRYPFDSSPLLDGPQGPPTAAEALGRFLAEIEALDPGAPRHSTLIFLIRHSFSFPIEILEAIVSERLAPFTPADESFTVGIVSHCLLEPPARPGSTAPSLAERFALFSRHGLGRDAFLRLCVKRTDPSLFSRLLDLAPELAGELAPQVAAVLADGALPPSQELGFVAKRLLPAFAERLGPDALDAVARLGPRLNPDALAFSPRLAAAIERLQVEAAARPSEPTAEGSPPGAASAGRPRL